jgi:rhodanese-related sulfurtransferase
MRSRQAVRWLRANGIANAINLTGGIDAWARQIDPAMRTY